MQRFRAVLKKIGINPYVELPTGVLDAVLAAAQKTKGPIPVRGTLAGKPYTQTLVRYAGAWRLYINTAMLEDSPQRIGETIDITVEFDTASRTLPMHPALEAVLAAHPAARQSWEHLSPSRQQEILRYLNRLVSAAALERNLAALTQVLSGKPDRYMGRDWN